MVKVKGQRAHQGGISIKMRGVGIYTYVSLYIYIKNQPRNT